jgi:hypothetical protein
MVCTSSVSLAFWLTPAAAAAAAKPLNPPAGPNILIDIKPLIKLNHSGMPKVESTVSQAAYQPPINA